MDKISIIKKAESDEEEGTVFKQVTICGTQLYFDYFEH